MLNLSVLPISLAVARLSVDQSIPRWAIQSTFFSITKTHDELSIVCSEDQVPHSVKAERGWTGLKVEGPLDFGLTGILSSLANPLAEAKISIFSISTYDTDYILVKTQNLQEAIKILSTFCNIQ